MDPLILSQYFSPLPWHPMRGFSIKPWEEVPGSYQGWGFLCTSSQAFAAQPSRTGGCKRPAGGCQDHFAKARAIRVDGWDERGTEAMYNRQQWRYMGYEHTSTMIWPAGSSIFCFCSAVLRMVRWYATHVIFGMGSLTTNQFQLMEEKQTYSKLLPLIGAAQSDSGLLHSAEPRATKLGTP